MRVVERKPKGKTIFPRPAVSVKILFNKKEMQDIRKQFLLDEEYNNPNKSFRFVGGTENEC